MRLALVGLVVAGCGGPSLTQEGNLCGPGQPDCPRPLVCLADDQGVERCRVPIDAGPLADARPADAQVLR